MVVVPAVALPLLLELLAGMVVVFVGRTTTGVLPPLLIMDVVAIF